VDDVRVLRVSVRGQPNWALATMLETDGFFLKQIQWERPIE
jgi:hypothetical protein